MILPALVGSVALQLLEFNPYDVPLEPLQSRLRISYSIEGSIEERDPFLWHFYAIRPGYLISAVTELGRTDGLPPLHISMNALKWRPLTPTSGGLVGIFTLREAFCRIIDSATNLSTVERDDLEIAFDDDSYAYTYISLGCKKPKA